MAAPLPARTPASASRLEELQEQQDPGSEPGSGSGRGPTPRQQRGAGRGCRAGRGAHLDSADQSFLPPAMPPPSPRPPCARAGPGGRRLTCAPLPRRPAQVRSHGRLSQPARPAALAPAAPSGLRAVGGPRPAALISAPGGPTESPRAPASCRAGPRTDRRTLGPARGRSAAGGEGGGLPAQNQLDQLRAGPPPLAGGRPECREGGRGRGPDDRGRAELAAGKAT